MEEDWAQVYLACVKYRADGQGKDKLMNVRLDVLLSQADAAEVLWCGVVIRQVRDDTEH